MHQAPLLVTSATTAVARGIGVERRGVDASADDDLGGRNLFLRRRATLAFHARSPRLVALAPRPRRARLVRITAVNDVAAAVSLAVVAGRVLPK